MRQSQSVTTPQPLVSIVLPTHNGSRYIDQSIESVLSQTHGNWELIIVDDASTDSTPARIARWTTHDNRIRAVTLHSNRRLPGALNEGFSRAAGDYFTWTSDDNWFDHRALERMVSVLADAPSAGVVYARSTLVSESGATVGYQSPRPPEHLPLSNIIGGCFLYRRRVHEELSGYQEDRFLVEDWDFWLRASARFTILNIEDLLYYYRLHTASLTASRSREIKLATANLLMQWLPNASSVNKQVRNEASARCGMRLAIAGEPASVFEDWLKRNTDVLGADNVNDIRAQMINLILVKLERAWRGRDWHAVERILEYCKDYKSNAHVRRVLGRRRYLRWFYSLAATARRPIMCVMRGATSRARMLCHKLAISV